MKILRVFEIEERRRAHVVDMHFIDNASCLQPEVSDTGSVILLSPEGVCICR